MAGGERERKKKKGEARFADKKRPRPSAAKCRELEQEKILRREGVYKLTADAGSDFFQFCPKDGHKLSGKSLRCAQCSAKWSGSVIALNHENHHIHLVDDRDFLSWWRKCMFRRLTFSEHNGVKWLSEPPVPFEVFHSIFESDFEEGQWETPAVRTYIRLLETCFAVESLCGFHFIEADKGFSACKVFGSGEMVMVVPPVRAVHTDSKVGGARVDIKFGWITMSIRGIINKANVMEEPAEGWSFVEARFRDEVKSAWDNKKGVDKSMVEHSEALLLDIYHGDKAAMLADRQRREEQQSSFFTLRPEDRQDDSWNVDRGDPGTRLPPIMGPAATLPLPDLPPLAAPLALPAPRPVPAPASPMRPLVLGNGSVVSPGTLSALVSGTWRPSGAGTCGGGASSSTIGGKGAKRKTNFA